MLFQDFDRGELILSSDCEIFIGASVVEMERLGNYGQLINAVAASPLLPSTRTSSAVTRVRARSFFQTCRKDRERHKPMTSTDHVVVCGCLWAMDGILVCWVSDVSVVSW